MAVEHGKRKRRSERVRPQEESGENDENHLRVRKKSEGAGTGLENELEEGEAEVFSPSSDGLIQRGAVWKGRSLHMAAEAPSNRQ
jgi:hypothetical protein